jgi:hypothetical protein
MPPPINNLSRATANTARLMTSPATARPLFKRATATPLTIAPSTAAGNVVNQFNHPRNGISPISRNSSAIRLSIRPMMPILTSLYGHVKNWLVDLAVASVRSIVMAA